MNAKWECQPEEFYGPINKHARLYSMYIAPYRAASLTGTESALNKVQPLLGQLTDSLCQAPPGHLPVRHPGGWADALGAEQDGVRYPLPSRGSGMLPTAIVAPPRLQQMETKPEEAQSTQQCSTQGK